MSTPPDDTVWAIWLIALPMSGALVALALPRIAAGVSLASAALVAVVTSILLGEIAVSPRRVSVGGWGAPLGIDLYADAPSGLMLAATSVVVLATFVYARSAAARTDADPHFWPIGLLLHAALNALFLSADLFNLYVSLELLSLSAVALVALAHDARALEAALRYLLASMVASVAYLLGVALLYEATGVLDLALLAERVTWSPVVGAALALMTSALALKGALFPVHFWLPDAHANAPSPVSALLSALVVEAPFFVLLRLWYAPFLDAPGSIADLLGLLGAAAIVWGSVQALRQERLKLLIAYSTIAQVGHLYLLFPLAQARGALQGVSILVVAHALAKAAMFLAAGEIQRHLGHDRIRDLYPAARKLPLTLAAFAVGGVCIMGMPPSGNFIGKWLLAEAAFEQGEPLWSVVVAAGGLLTAAYVFRVLGHAFGVDDEGGSTVAAPTTMAWTAFILALLALVLGLAAAPLVDFTRAAGEMAAGPTRVAPQ